MFFPPKAAFIVKVCQVGQEIYLWIYKSAGAFGTIEVQIAPVFSSSMEFSLMFNPTNVGRTTGSETTHEKLNYIFQKEGLGAPPTSYRIHACDIKAT